MSKSTIQVFIGEALQQKGKPCPITLCEKLIVQEETDRRCQVSLDGSCCFLGRSVLLKAKCCFRLHLECDRCLDRYESSFTTSVEEEFHHANSATAVAHFVERGSPRFYYSGNIIKLEEWLRQTLCLALPTKKLCSLECKGLCSSCGCNLNRSSCRCASPAQKAALP